MRFNNPHQDKKYLNYTNLLSEFHLLHNIKEAREGTWRPAGERVFLTRPEIARRVMRGWCRRWGRIGRALPRRWGWGSCPQTTSAAARSPCRWKEMLNRIQISVFWNARETRKLEWILKISREQSWKKCFDSSYTSERNDDSWKQMLAIRVIKYRSE